MVLLLACSITIYSLVLYFLPKTYQTELEHEFIVGFNELIEVLEQDGVENNTQEIANFASRNNATIIVTEKDGEELLSIKTAISDGELNDVKSVSSFAEFSSNNKPYTISATANFVAVAQSYQVLINLIPIIAVVIILISLIGAFVFSRYFSKPLVDVSEVAKRMTNLDLTWECDTSRTDEIGVLSSSLNEMSKRLKESINSLETANRQLLYDIENKNIQEKQRIDFFTAVSHELKTPITIIKGELEGMLYQVGDFKDRDTYLRHSLKTVSSMEKLVKEILESARMGGNDFKIERTDLNVRDIVKKCCHSVQWIIEDKEMKLSLEVQPNFHYNGDKRLIEKAISNIINNAVIYSPEKEQVNVILKGSTLVVENSGVNIKNEELKQLFNPFFRIDKSRNSNTGGSGLGLYIVKTIFDHHCIRYCIENSKSGVKFTIHFDN